MVARRTYRGPRLTVKLTMVSTRDNSMIETLTASTMQITSSHGNKSKRTGTPRPVVQSVTFVATEVPYSDTVAKRKGRST